jgi:probable F420-dependent oxidoreductase
MRIDVRLNAGLDGAQTVAAELESAGYSGIWSREAEHDPFLPLVHVAATTTKIELGTSITVAFGRSPMTVAMAANDLQAYSHGRFVLGLGSQVQPHITRRYSMPWSSPAARMREYVLALRAIWATWNEGQKLDFRGEFYTHTLMTPFFAPPPHKFGPPKVLVAGVGSRMTEAAGEVGDGFLCHPFTTERYLRERTIPALETGRSSAGKTMEGFQIAGPSFVVTGWTEQERAEAERATRRQIAFYGSTPAYRGVLELHGWQGLQEKLNSLSKAGKWDDMAHLIDDEVLGAFAIVAEPDRLADELKSRYGDVVDRIALYLPYEYDSPDWRRVIEALREV